MGGIRAMDIHNFQLGSVFHQNAKEYVTRPVKAMKYQPGLGIENSWMVYFEGSPSNEGKSSHFGVKFFPTKETAQNFIDADEKQYAMENGVRVGMKVKCDEPLPVLYREEPDIEKNEGILFQFGDKAFISDESEKYEFYILDSNWCDCDTWIIQDMDGNIRVWDRTMMDELFFFGKEAECGYEKTDRGEYLQVAV